MSEHITHIAVYEDLVRIVLRDPEVCEPFKFVLEKQYDSGLLGSGSRGNNDFAVPILKMFKDTWDDEKHQREAQIKLAYALGWLTHRAADRRLKLVFATAEDDPNPAFSNSGCRIYQDAMSFRKVYDGGRQPCLSPHEALSTATFASEMNTHSGANHINVPETESLLNRMWQVDMISKHAFFADQSDLLAWLNVFVDRFPDLTEDLRDYEKAYNDPDPVLVQRYYVKDNYYDETDDIIKFVRAIQNGKEPMDDLSTLVQKARTQSLYSQVLRQGFFYIRGASDYFTGKISQQDLWDILRKRIS